MRLIKRYPNRKLYDTEARRYVTLEGVAGLIRGGHEVQVVDHASGEDLTSVTLTQVIVELEKGRSGSVPQAVLTGLIRAGGDTLAGLRRRLALPAEWEADDEMDSRLGVLVRRGEMALEEARWMGDRLPAERPLPDDEEIEASLARLGVPTRLDLARLAEQVDRLIDSLGRAEVTVPNTDSDSDPRSLGFRGSESKGV